MNKIIIDHLTFSYRNKKDILISNLDFQAETGSIISLIGINGSGKTTILLLILGLLTPTSGEIIIINSKDRTLPNNFLHTIGFLPQFEDIPLNYTVREYLLLGRLPHHGLFSNPKKHDYEIIAELIAELKLRDFSESPLSQISGGEFQRVRIARALAQEPALILLDEPSTHLDISSKRNIFNLLVSLKNDGKTIIFSTHDPFEAIKYSDYCIILNKNQKPIAGLTSQVINSANLTKYFHVKCEIRDVEGQTVILYK